ncbi:short-chain dehydrogenase [Haladaptatus sp. W1]|uniref:SDR family NAD(P)-dependent oxidoreductase n=1 Tax=Haladaptatus sp. W1 TaxID=1897478 RepID=UPI00084994E7|nr:SDR family oxidoreductase [Haladaptatus sp. W1]ODR81750.1 short-chain dehydrogenase [Haladaptatus sp. W1]
MDGLTAVITGGTRGIGRRVAESFADEGATVALCGRDAGEVDATVETIEGAGGNAVGVRADVRDEFDVERLVETAAREGEDGIDVVVANAGVYHGTPGETPLTTESYAAFDDTLRTNCRGVYTVIRESLPHLAEDARILVSTGSIGHETHAGYGSYAVSKAAAEGLVRGFSTELDGTVVGIDPGVVGTEMMGGKGRDPEDVAGLFVWAATDAEDVNGEIVGLKRWRQATRE